MTTTPSPTPFAQGENLQVNILAPGSQLDEYRIDSILGVGGFGATYKAFDLNLGIWVALKEYFPAEWSFRDPDGVTVHPSIEGQAGGSKEQEAFYYWGLERFLDEARVLARIAHPLVARVKRYFQAHGTAYIVMDYEEGQTLHAMLPAGETLDEDEVHGLLEDVLPALRAVHEQGYLHRDIKPANLYARATDHRVMLIDFGAARTAVGRYSKSMTSLVTPGYSPPEQYSTRNDRYGAWTDIYALGAVLYRCVTGHPPTDAVERLLADRLEPAVLAGAGRYDIRLLEMIDRALAVRPERRFQTVAEMQAVLGGAPDGDPAGPVESGQAAPEPDRPRPVESSGPPPEAESSGRRWSLGTLAGGGLGLVAMAGIAAFWFWPSAPVLEDPPPARQHLNQREQSVETPPASHPTPAGLPVPAATPPALPMSAVPVPALPTPDSTVSGSPPMATEPVVSPGEFTTGTPAPPVEPPVVETRIKSKPPIAEPQNHRIQPQPRLAKPRKGATVRRGRTMAVRNPWESPTSTGFNQK
ncbi:MAG: protein kinase [Candidatus Competibacter sp.]|nr:protein kinase [Candidatus Competibacter sp.]